MTSTYPGDEYLEALIKDVVKEVSGLISDAFVWDADNFDDIAEFVDMNHERIYNLARDAALGRLWLVNQAGEG